MVNWVPMWHRPSPCAVCSFECGHRGLHAMVTSVPASSDSPVDPCGDRAVEPLLSIAAVERETGLGKDTLRAWERRYGFPRPQRDAAGMRGYPRALVERLALIRRALLAGQRPGRLLSMPADELDALLAGLAPAPRASGAPALDAGQAIAALRAGGAAGLRHWLTLRLARMGLESFVVDGVAPLTEAIGVAWADGDVAVFEEHLYSEVLQSVLRAALAPFQAGLHPQGPRVLLTTVPGEAHGMGLLMAEALLTLQACPCLSLGTQTPLGDIVAAARAQRVDVVALSFSTSLCPALALPALAELRARLPASVQVWAGGAMPALRGSRIAGIRIVSQLGQIAGAVADWRGASSPTAD